MPTNSPSLSKRLLGVLRWDLPARRRAMADAYHGNTPLTHYFKKVAKPLAPRGKCHMVVGFAPPLALLWSFLPGDGSPAATIHKAHLREVWRERGLGDRARLLALLVLLWPVVNLEAISWYTFIHGPAIRRRTGKSSVRQALEQLRVSALHGIRPKKYYTFELFDDAKRAHAADYLNRFETKDGLYFLVKRYGRSAGHSGVKDKAKYTEICREHGVPTIPVLAVARKGAFRMAAGEGESLPPQDLFVKPIRGKGGDGAESWRCNGPDSYTSSRGDITFTSSQLADHIARLSQTQAYLVNVRVTNHPDIADLSNGALCTLRILSVKNERGEFEATDAVLRMAVGENTVVDNFHAGGIGANVDVATGELGLATGLRLDSAWWDHHPTTGAKILGRRLCCWEEVLDLVRRAHAVFPDYLVIGWDVAILEGGPCAVEANGSPDLDIHQRCGGTPLGNRRMGELFAFHVEQALSARAAAG